MRILHVVHSLVPGEYRGGISKVVHELASAQAELGNRVDVFTTNLNSGVATEIPAGHVAQFDRLQVTYFAARGAASPELARRLLRDVHQFDVLHAHNPLSPLNRYACRAALRCQVPLFAHLHGALNPYGQESWYRYVRRAAYLRLVERFNLRAANKVFALSHHEAVHAEQIVGAGNMQLLPNGTSLIGAKQSADPARFRQKFGLGDSPVLMFLGRICDIKGVHLLLEAFARLAREYPHWQLVIAGSREQFPSYIRRLDALAQTRGLVDRIVWPGFLNEAEKIDALAAADVFCHPSETEGMPMAVLEAMALELPSVIGKGCFMTEAANAEAVVECDFSLASVEAQLRGLMASCQSRVRLSRAAGDHAALQHSWQAIARQTLGHYSRGANSKTARRAA